MRSLLAAVLIVKDEAKVICRTLDSLVGVVEVILVLDTGSTDGTQDVIEKWWATSGVNVHLVEEPFVDFATTRNRALALAAEKCPTAFTLTLSADEVLDGGEALRAFLKEHITPQNGQGGGTALPGAYCVMLRTGPRQWPFPRVLRAGGGWQFVNEAGRRHEQPVHCAGEALGPLIRGVTVVHEESDIPRKLARLRDRDLPDLTSVVEDEAKSLAERMESMLQLAETHFILGDGERDADGNRALGGRWLSHLFQAMALYARYAETAETFSKKMTEIGEAEADGKYLFQKGMYAHLMYLHVAESFGLFEPSELVKRVELVAKSAPHLPEAHWMLAKNVAKVDHRKAIPLCMKSAEVAHRVLENPVFGPVDTRLEYKSWLLASVCSKMIGNWKMQRDFARRAFDAGAPPEEVVGAGVSDLRVVTSA